MQARIQCDGLQVGTWIIPSFTLSGGECVWLHLDRWHAKEEKHLLALMSGRIAHTNLRFFGKPLLAPLAAPNSRWWRELILPETPLRWLCRTTGITKLQAQAIVSKVGLDTEVPLCQLGSNPRKLLGLEAAWIQGADIVLFDTRGNDPVGVRTIFDAIASMLEQGAAAIYLSYPMISGSGVPYPRECPAGAKCLEVTVTSASPASAAPSQ